MEPKYTWTFEPDSLLLRYYSGVWGLDPTTADFCKLFWSVVLFPIGILIVLPGRKIVLPTAVGVGEALAMLVAMVLGWFEARESRPAASTSLPETPKQTKPPKVKTGPSWSERLLNAVAHFVARPKVRLAARIAFWVVMVGAGLVALATIGYLLVEHILTVLLVGGILIAGVVVIFALAAVCVTVERRIKRRSRRVKGPSRARLFLRRCGERAVTAAAFLGEGIYAVKSNTCPRIVVRGAEPSASSTPSKGTT